jgi:hypothetical protein
MFECVDRQFESVQELSAAIVEASNLQIHFLGKKKMIKISCNQKKG